MAGEEPGIGGEGSTINAPSEQNATDSNLSPNAETITSGQNTKTAALGDNTQNGDYVDKESPPLVHWSRHLKCQVCFSYLKQPHTLTCGHSFCKPCLVRLSQTSKASNPGVPVRRLCLPCPTCRAMFSASTLLRGHASTSFLIQSIISDWKKERKRIKSLSAASLRSICTQTIHRTAHRQRRRKSPNSQDVDLHQQFHKRVRLDDLYYRSMTAHSSDSSEDNEAATGAKASDQQPDPFVNSSDTSSLSSSSSGPGFVFGRRFEDFGYLGVAQRADWSPGRVLLMSVWCMYSMVVVGIAQPMLPYMVLITLFFLVLILR